MCPLRTNYRTQLRLSRKYVPFSDLRIRLLACKARAIVIIIWPLPMQRSLRQIPPIVTALMILLRAHPFKGMPSATCTIRFSLVN